MARYGAAGRTGAGSATLPIIGLYSSASQNGQIREIGVFNTTAVAVSFAIQRVSTAGTWTTLASQTEDTISPAAASVAKITATVAPTLVAGVIRAFTLGAAVGSGVILTFDDLSTGLAAVTAGVVVVPVGTGQICDAWIKWEE